ncbi:hypothetical protein [Microseira wollei]|uniref:Serine/threonine protein kinase n=1 Tax=Microseira wollei NIES-4236 TaxID=2530354 RepID=A0AAV3XP90_9CYAN|nr:hypothetical protein [Microseira wollei]GET43468.1 hypothetical protein MiSe_82920 [Microseira wollei NIES-4236]
MNAIQPEPKKFLRTKAWLLSTLLSVPLFAACSSPRQQYTPPPPVDDTRGGRVVPPPANQQPQARRGLSTGQTVAILAGAAALYYLYNQHRNRQGHGAQGKYYLSKNGRVYYRDAQGQAHWVTPPREGIRVPVEEAQRYRDFQGYNGRTDGRDLTDLVPAQ